MTDDIDPEDTPFLTYEQLQAIKDEAERFAWKDRTADVAKLYELARKHSPDGSATFRLIEKYTPPQDDDGTAEIMLPAAMIEWLTYLEDKYGSFQMAMVIQRKFLAPLVTDADDEPCDSSPHDWN